MATNPEKTSKTHAAEFDVFAPLLAHRPAPTVPLGPALPDTATTLASARLGRRSVLLGLGLVMAVAVLTPINDYVLMNNPLIGNHLPVGILTVVVALVLVANPLLGWFNRKPLSTAELVVILSMMLVGAAAPSSGLTRYLEPSILQPTALMDPDKSGVSFRFLEPIHDLLPSWFGPTKDPSSPIIRMYEQGVDPARHESIPVVAFLLPALWWSILIASLFGAMVLIAAVFRRQWVHHERLSYPLAVVQMELLASAERGHAYNRLWRNPILWAGLAIPFFVYLLGGLHSVFPAVPGISLEYDHLDKFTEIPWCYIPDWIVKNRIYFSGIGLAFFLPSEVGLSLWLFVLLSGVAHALLMQRVDTDQAVPVRGMGAYTAYFLAVLWIGRRHLGHVLKCAWRGTAREESEFATYRTMVIGLLVCVAAGGVWLMAAGVGPGAALLLLVLGAMIATLMARVVAETGLFFLGLQWQITDLFTSLLGPKMMGLSSFYISDVVSNIFFGDVREILTPYAATSLRMGSELRPPARPAMLRWMFAAIFVSVLVATVTQHTLSYMYGREQIADSHANVTVPHGALHRAFEFGYTQDRVNHAAAWTNFGIGGALVTVFMVARGLFVWWPFHAVGILLMDSWTVHAFWISVCIGWWIKFLLLRYGGAAVFRRARPFFIGLIVGEVVTAGLWMYLGLMTNGAVSFTVFPK